MKEFNHGRTSNRRKKQLLSKGKDCGLGHPDRQSNGAQRPHRNRGYSEISLSMLKSKEGQLNAIFAVYGSAAQHGQLFEDSVEKLIIALNEMSGSEEKVEKIGKWTLGCMLNHFRKNFVNEIDEWVPAYLEEGRCLRNFLIHDYFLRRGEKFVTRSGRMSVLKELSDIEQHLKRCADLLNGLRYAVREKMGGRTRNASEGGKVVFSVELGVGKGEA